MGISFDDNSKALNLGFLSGGGDMGKRIREYGWLQSPLGSPDVWPQSLRSSVSICLNSNFPIAIYWGEQLTLLYNDAWSPIPGSKHPWALGKSAEEVWPEIWEFIEPQFKKAFTGTPGGSDNALLPMNRHGFTEECYFNFTFTPIYGEGGTVEGIFNAVIETTKTVLNERQLQTLHDLGSLDRAARTVDDVLVTAAKVLGQNNKDFPFGIIYKTDEDGLQARANAYIGLGPDQNVFPASISLTETTINTSNFFRAYHDNTIVVSENNGRRRDLPLGHWNVEATHFVHLPITCPGRKMPVAIFSAALNPHRQFDDSYRQFVQLIADQISTEVNNVLAYEEERRRAEELAAIDKAKTAFFTNISHEFRTPLTLMLGSLEELLKKEDKALSIEVSNAVETSHRNALRLLRLVNNLLDFSRIEAGRTNAVFQKSDICQYTAELVSTFRSVVEQAGLAFTFHCDKINHPVFIDREMWEKIVLNLLSNAFKYTLRGSIDVRLAADKDQFILTVADTGTGIPQSELPKMFERFHRVQNTTGRTYEGTGIGLSLVKELTSLHGGQVSVKSDEGIGSEFSVTIPYGYKHLPSESIVETATETTSIIRAETFIEEAQSLIAKTHININGKRLGAATILIVDDNADMRSYLASILQADFNIVTAENGRDALAQLSIHHVDAVVSDVMMPVMDGIELLKTIKSNSQMTTLPVILVSARAGEDARIEGYDIGADDYLAKPFTSKELLARVRSQVVLAKKRNNILQNIFNVFDGVPFAVAVLTGEDLIVEFVNKYNLDIWQQSKEDVLGRPLFEVRPDIRKDAEKIHAEVYRTGERFTANELPVQLLTNGIVEQRYFTTIIDVLRDETGNIIGQLATSIETTAEVLARKTIVENEQETRRMNYYLTEELKSTKILQQFNSSFFKDDNTFYHSILVTALNLMTADNASIHLYDERGHSLKLIAAENLNSDRTQHREYIKEDSGSVYNDAIHSRKRIVISDVELADCEEDELEYFRKTGIRSLQSTPLIGRSGRFLGLLSTYWSTSHKAELEDFKYFDVLISQIGDLIEKRAVEQKIEESEERYALTVSAANLGIWDFDVKNQTVVGSGRIDSIYGLNSNDEYDLNFAFGSIHPDDREEQAAFYDAIIEGKIDTNFSTQYRIVQHNTNTVRWIKAYGKAFFDENGILVRTVGTVADITEQKLAENILKESESRFRTLTQSLPQLVWTATKDGFCDFFNQKWYDYTGSTAEQSIGDGWVKCVNADFVHRLDNDWKFSLETGEPLAIELQLRNNNGKYEWFYALVNPVKDTEGEILKWVGALTNIEERKEAEARLEQLVEERTMELQKANRELHRSNEDLQQFAHVASHDLKEPVRKIGIFINRLKEEFYSSLPEKGAVYVDKIESAAERMRMMIDGVLIYSSLGALDREVENVDLNVIIENIKTDLELAIAQKGAKISLSEPLPTICGSSVLLHQLFYNLINNALKFTKTSVEPLIRIEHEQLAAADIIRKGLNSTKHYIVIKIIDNGIGFKQKYADQIFKTFTRLNSKDKYEGTGLGLALSKKIVETHEGLIEAIATEGEGATFNVTLPFSYC